MSEKKKPSGEFSHSHRVALALSGTVAVPSPFPASGRVSIGVFPPPDEASTPEYYLKVVELLHDKQIVTRLMRLEDLRAVSLPTPSNPEPGKKSWSLKTAAELNQQIDKKKKDLGKLSSSDVPHEVELFPEAIVHVPESAPVLHRLDHAVTAARSVENALGGTWTCPHCP